MFFIEASYITFESLLTSNAVYVGYRLVALYALMRWLSKYFSFYAAALIMSQISYIFDSINFFFLLSSDWTLPSFILTDTLYVVRVAFAWWFVRCLWQCIGNYWLAVFIAAEVTWVMDLYIFSLFH